MPPIEENFPYMATPNPHLQSLKGTYLFPLIRQKLAEQRKASPDAEVLNLGVGDISLPLAPTIAHAICTATQEMTITPRGYGPSEGYPFLREAICSHEYAQYGLTPEEIFVSDGTNSDSSSIQELFSNETIVAMPDPTYPAYLDANRIAGKKILFLPCIKEEGFVPRPPKERADLVYLCTPSNPIGVALTVEDLQQWIDWAKEHSAILIIDNVYNAFITSDEIPDSIYSLDGAKEVAIEMRSFSKTAGFTGLRCSYTVVPKSLHIPELHSMWFRRMSAKFNGVPYPIQKGALACFSEQGQEEIQKQIATYTSSAKILRQALTRSGHTFYGGLNSPYIWWATPDGMSSWEFFDILLEREQIIAIPGSGFGSCGEGYIRLSSFISEKIAQKAGQRIEALCATL
ncbi:MAG: LL-diaminopimelate aminotransferase [Chlamydiae bacterium]|nr:LL-diaminopimelate aminotransferase [Chlamydiota bacterium]